MADFSKSKNRRGDLTRIRVRGDLKPGELLRFAASTGHGRRTRLVIWDLRQASWAGISARDLLNNIDSARAYSKPGYRTAFVFSNKVDYGLGRMMENYTEAQDFEGEYRSFHSLDEAEAWMRSRDPVAPTYLNFPEAV